MSDVSELQTLRVGLPGKLVMVIVVDDDPQCLALVRAALKRDDLEIFGSEDPAGALELIKRGE